MSSGGGRPLIERAQELDTLSRALGAARAGDGQMVLVEGSPGIGKSQLLEAGRERAEQSGMRLLAARGRVLETEFGLGVARQLLERVLSDPKMRERAANGPAAHAGVLLHGAAPESGGSGEAQDLIAAHSLYWLTVALAESGPLLLAVDDLQWADAASTRFLAYLSHRLTELPVALVLACRSGERPAMLAGVEQDPHATTLRLKELSEPGVHALVAAQLPHAAAEVLVACLVAG
jgi:predicted ATPase